MQTGPALRPPKELARAVASQQSRRRRCSSVAGRCGTCRGSQSSLREWGRPSCPRFRRSSLGVGPDRTCFGALGLRALTLWEQHHAHAKHRQPLYLPPRSTAHKHSGGLVLAGRGDAVGAPTSMNRMLLRCAAALLACRPEQTAISRSEAPTRRARAADLNITDLTRFCCRPFASGLKINFDEAGIRGADGNLPLSHGRREQAPA